MFSLTSATTSVIVVFKLREVSLIARARGIKMVDAKKSWGTFRSTVIKRIREDINYN